MMLWEGPQPGQMMQGLREVERRWESAPVQARPGLLYLFESLARAYLALVTR